MKFLKRALPIVLAVCMLASLCAVSAIDAGETRTVIGADLTDEQIDQITNLGVRIAQLDLDPEQLAGQLQSLVNNFQRLQNLSEQASGLWSRIESAFQGFWSWLTGLFR